MGKLLLIPGPTNLSKAVMEVMSMPQVSHTGKEFHDSFVEILKLSRYLFGNQKGHQFVFTGTGTTGMETSVYSLLGHEDKALVLVNGYFGKRFVIINNAHKIEVKELEFEQGRHADPEVLGKELRKEKYKAVFITHVETSTGVRNQVKELVEECSKNGVFSVVDSVCGIGGEEISFDELGADILFTASQKAIAGPPGAVLMAVSNNAMEYIEKRSNEIESYYMNLARWRPVMEDPKIYLATPATQVLLGLKKALEELKQEGLVKRWERHRRLAEIVREFVFSSNLKPVAEREYMANTVTSFYVPDGSAQAIQREIEERYGIVVARGIGNDSDRIIRIGHMGILDEETLKDAVEKVRRVVVNYARA